MSILYLTFQRAGSEASGGLASPNRGSPPLHPHHHTQSRIPHSSDLPSPSPGSGLAYSPAQPAITGLPFPHQPATAHPHPHSSAGAGSSSATLMPRMTFNPEGGPNGRGPAMSPAGGPIQLWQFLLELLTDKDCSHVIAWTGNEWEFKMVKPDEVGDNI